jgi:hypothetical protein
MTIGNTLAVIGGFMILTGTPKACWTRPPPVRRAPRMVARRKVTPPRIMPMPKNLKAGSQILVA